MTIFEQVLSFINAPDAAHFESLSLAVFQYQAQHVPAYREYLTSLNVDPRNIRSFGTIPPVSTLAYKYARIENELHAKSPASRLFLTSGTTLGGDERGLHLVPEPEIYRLSAIRHLGRMMFPDAARMAMLALHPTADRMPESSLAQMISWCISEFGDSSTFCAATPQSVDTAGAIEFLKDAQRRGSPACVLGTTASYGSLLDAIRQSGVALRLPAGSRLMDTGGAKGQRSPLSAEQVAAQAHELLGIEQPLVINEYGMTEMCSQLYDATSFNSESGAPPGRRMKVAPPWLRPVALDPITLKPNADGQPGMLAFFDLANAGSISALITEDVGIVRGNMVAVFGRATGADRRGCALAIQQFANSSESSLSLSRKTGRNVSVVDQQARTSSTESKNAASSLAASEIHAAATRLRRLLSIAPPQNEPHTDGAIFRKLMEVVTGSPRWQQATHLIATELGYSESLLAVSLHALISPLRDAVELAGKVRPRRELLGFIMPGNVPGAGIHELVIALAAGCAAIVKTSSPEPVFFTELRASLLELDGRGSGLGARMEVFNWGREHADLTDVLLTTCDRVIAFGDDATMVDLARQARDGRLLAFGNRFSVAAVMGEAAWGSAMAQTAEALALDCAMFDQRGCLSPHHIFVEKQAYEFAEALAAAFSRLAPLFGADGLPRELDLQDAAAIRRVRETARWRKLNGGKVQLWEDINFQWTVVFDEVANFTSSPGFRTLFVSPFNDPPDLERRLEAVHGRLEGFALAAGQTAAGTADFSRLDRSAQSPRAEQVRGIATRCGATYICPPGAMQSPPLDWPHGGGEFIRMFIG